MLLVRSEASFSGHILADKGINRAGKGFIGAGYGNKNKMDF